MEVIYRVESKKLDGTWQDLNLWYTHGARHIQSEDLEMLKKAAFNLRKAYFLTYFRIVAHITSKSKVILYAE